MNDPLLVAKSDDAGQGTGQTLTAGEWQVLSGLPGGGLVGHESS
jgi:hypothetical protein